MDRTRTEALRAAVASPLFPAEQARLEPPVAAARAQLSPDKWAAAWAAGRAMSFEEAVAYALEESRQ